MAAKAGRSHQVVGELELAGVLRERHVRGNFHVPTGCVVWDGGIQATVMCSDSATIQSGAFVIRTALGSSADGRTHTDQFVYVPFRSRTKHNACIMEIKHLMLVHRQGMGWPNDEARLAVGTLWDNLSIREGAGLETAFNDDPTRGACSIPRALFMSPTRRKKGYNHIVHIRQIACPCVYIPDREKGDYFITISKMGFTGRRDLLFEAACGQSQEDDSGGGGSS